MVIIANISKDIDKYLNTRRKSEDRRGFVIGRRKPPKEEPAAVPEDLKSDEVRVLEDREPSFWERLFKKEKLIVSEDLTTEEMARLEAMEEDIEAVEHAEQEHPEMMEELEDVRESLLDRFFGMFDIFQRKHRLDRKAAELEYIEEEVVPRIDQDVKEVLKIVHKWLAKLPRRQRDDFRKSNDFRRYKDLLEKYGVAKRKAEEPRGEPKDKPAIDVTQDGEYKVMGKKK